MKKAELINLYTIIRNLKSTNLTLEAKKNYTLLRIKLVKLFREFEEAREEIVTQTKPEDGDTTNWDKQFQPIMVEWLNVETDIDTKVFNVEEYIDFISSNELAGDVEDYIGLLMIKD